MASEVLGRRPNVPNVGLPAICQLPPEHDDGL